MLQVDIEDVLAVLDLCVPHLVVIGVAVVAMLVAMVVVRKRPKPQRFLARAQAAIACVLVVAVHCRFFFDASGPVSQAPIIETI